jgi:hypothetical protein
MNFTPALGKPTHGSNRLSMFRLTCEFSFWAAAAVSDVRLA